MKKLSAKGLLEFIQSFISSRAKGKQTSTTTLLSSSGDESEKIQQIRESLDTVLRQHQTEKGEDEKLRRIRELLVTEQYAIPPKKSKEPKI